MAIFYSETHHKLGDHSLRNVVLVDHELIDGHYLLGDHACLENSVVFKEEKVFFFF